MFGEPPRTQFDLHFNLLGVPVRVHPMFWVIALLFGMGGNPEPGRMLIWVGVVFLSVLVHEMGHALVARNFGCRPWITLHGFGGLASYRSSFLTATKQILILLAGPGAGFLLAALVIACLYLTRNMIAIGDIEIGSGRFISSGTPLWQLVADLLFVNIAWGIVNLFPVYPLDGGQITRQLLLSLNPWQGIRQSLILSMLAGGLLAFAAFYYFGRPYVAIFFAYMAFLNYQQLRGPGGFRGGW